MYSKDFNVRLCVTDLFYADGAVFNKGRAMEWARKNTMDWKDWALFFDADVVPPEGWADQLGFLKRDFLYGCTRVECKTHKDLEKPMLKLQPMPHDVPGVGFFQLFHTDDPVVNRKLPVIPTEWAHAGNYDNEFMNKWRNNGVRVQRLPITLYHVGERDNWLGRGNKEGFAAMQEERKRRGGRWDHEVILDGVAPID